MTTKAKSRGEQQTATPQATQGANVKPEPQQQAQQSTALVTTQPVGPGAGVVPWNPFELMDRLDADAFVKEMEGIASDVLVYRVKDNGKEMTALSKGGIDECCTMLVSTGQCIREESITFEMFGDGENREAMFKAVAARYAVKNDGTEVRLDQVIGVKREPLYESRAPLTLDARVPGKRWATKGTGGKALTYREALDEAHPANEGKGEVLGYLRWIAEQSTFDDLTKAFVAAILAGQDVGEFAAGKRFNSFWYEHGAMKAARNARSRLIPAGVKAQVIAMANESARVREIERPTPQQEEKQQQRARPQFLRRDAAAAEVLFPFRPKAGIPLDAKFPVDHKNAGHYMIGRTMLGKAINHIDELLAGKLIERGQGEQSAATDAERKQLAEMKAAILRENDQRDLEADSQRPAEQPTSSKATGEARSADDDVTDDRPLGEDEEDDDLPF